MNMSWLFLFLAIVSEIIATSALKASQNASRIEIIGASVLIVLGYSVAFYFLSLSLKHLPLGVAYAIWSGVGTAGAVTVGVFLFRESLNVPRVIGVLLIIAGVLVLNAFTKGAA